MSLLTKLRYRRQLENAAEACADKRNPEIPWLIRWWLGEDEIKRILMLAFVEGCEWQDEQNNGDST